MKFIYDDGGRSAAGFTSTAGDCVARSVAIATGIPYAEVYAALAHGNVKQRRTKHDRGRRTRSASRGINTNRKWFSDYMASLGWTWTPTMQIGSGCKVHLADGELPMGRLIVNVSKHYTAVIDGVIYDTHDPQREAHIIEPDTGRELKPGEWRNENGICRIARRCVYGYWAKTLA